MAKASTWLKGASGQVAGMTLYQSGGKTIIRETKSAISNPQTFAQMVQRVIAKTAMNQYSALQEIANHSFQGLSSGSKCMSRFLSRNMNYFRERAVEIQQAGGSIYNFYQFAYKGEQKYTPAAVILSEGKLPRISTSIQQNGTQAFVQYNQGSTYGDIIKGFGLKRGDQLTFVTVEKDVVTGEFIPHFARVILDPRNADGSAAPLTTDFTSVGNVINCPNFRNSGTFRGITTSAPGILYFNLSGGLVAAAGIIVSRKAKNMWLRSYCKLVINESVIGADLLSLGDAADLSVSSGEIYTDNNAYLNNAGTGGPQGVYTPPSSSNDAQYSNNVLINGVPQDVGGGSVEIGATLSSIVINGTNLVANSVKLEAGSEEPETFTGSGNSLSWSGNIVTNSSMVVTVKRDNAVWFVINLDGIIHGLE